ncbi:MAG: ABC transporter ATP-binding protein [Planctomycetes bacterium]|nr:ABC transporter ATP-binding protein [Planctomycetota bacterium]
MLEARGLTKNFGRLRAVDDVSFAVHRGRVTGFIGPNGAGKTTTMRILATLELPDAGDAWIDGLSVLEEPRGVRERVGFMADRFDAYPNLDVMQFLDFFARAYGLRGRDRIRTVRQVAEFCGLTSFAGRPATGLSKGMGQRLHLAKTLLHSPALLILDEPASGLDPRARIEFRELVRALAADGVAVLISSHILAELGELCDDVLVVEQGRLAVAGALKDVARAVHGAHRIAMRVVGGDQAALQRFLVLQPQVRDVDSVGERVEFSLDGDDQVAAALLARAVGAGLQVVEFVPEAADLEEIFLHATRGRLQ